MGAAWLVYKNEEGIYKYLQTITAYLVLPVFPAIFFGIVSKKVTNKGAAASVLVGIALATVFVVDQFLPVETARQVFPFLHHKLTLNFGYRGLWAEIIITGVLFAVSAVTPKTAPEKPKKTTINYSKGIAPFEGWSDWRLHLTILSLVTLFLYIWLSYTFGSLCLGGNWLTLKDEKTTRGFTLFEFFLKPDY
jgi:SSS family solute:Na+ symporter